MAVQALVVDLDGTIWESRSWYAEIIADASAIPVEEVLQSLERVPIPTLIGQTPVITKSRFSAQIRAKADRLSLYPTVRETLDLLSASDTELVAATSLPGWIAQPLLEEKGLRQVFSFVADASGPHRKPDPQVLEVVLPGVELTEESVFVVGDDRRDAELARRAGVGFAWAAYGYGSEPDLPKFQRLETFGDILNL